MTDQHEIELIEDENELNTYSYISNGLYFEYFVGYEITALLGYKNPAEVIKNNVSKCNQIEFKNYPGIKEPEINPKAILISRDGAIEILIKTRKRISPDVAYILKKFNIETTNRKCLTKEQQTLSTITNVFKTEKFEDQYKIGTYYLDLYFSEYKIVIECDENGHADRKPWRERERMDYVNEKLEIDDSHWIRFNPDEHDFDISRVIGRIYRKMDEIKEEEMKEREKEYKKLLLEKKDDIEDDNSIKLNVYSYMENDIYMEYFIGVEITNLLEYKSPSDVLSEIVSDCNKIKFNEYKGEKNPKLNGNKMLITRKGVVEILIRTTKKIKVPIIKLLKKYKFDITMKNNRKMVEDIKNKIKEEKVEEEKIENIEDDIQEEEVEDIKKLTVYSYVDNNICYEYFLGNQISKLIGYSQTNEIKKFISKNNMIEFCDYPGDKTYKLYPRAMLINREGVKEIIVNTRKYLTSFIKDIFRKSSFDIKIENNKKTVNYIEIEDEIKNEFENKISEDESNIIIENIKKIFASEKYIQNYEIKDKYKVGLYFPEYKIVIDSDRDKERFLNINDNLKIDESFWIRYDNEPDISKIIGQLYEIMKSKGKVVYQVCNSCKISKELIEYHNSSRNPLRVEYCCKVCRSIKTKEEKIKKIKKLEEVEITEKNCSKCEKTFPISNFWKSIKEKDGYVKYCKDCGKEHRKEAQEKNRKEPEDFRKCTKCAIIKSKEEFSKYSESYDGLHPMCIICLKYLRKKEYNDNRKVINVQSV